jgi:hypothetical protein
MPRVVAGQARVDDAVVPEVRGREHRVRFLLDLQLQHALHHLELLLVQHLARARRRLALDDVEHAGELLRAHDRDLVVGPREQKARVVGASGHPVVARPRSWRPSSQ